MTELVLAPEIEEVKVLAGKEFELKPKKVQAILFTDEESGREAWAWITSFGDAVATFEPSTFVPAHQSIWGIFGDFWTSPRITIEPDFNIDTNQYDNWFETLYLDAGVWIIRTEIGTFEYMTEEDFVANYQEV